MDKKKNDNKTIIEYVTIKSAPHPPKSEANERSRRDMDERQQRRHQTESMKMWIDKDINNILKRYQHRIDKQKYELLREALSNVKNGDSLVATCAPESIVASVDNKIGNRNQSTPKNASNNQAKNNVEYGLCETYDPEFATLFELPWKWIPTLDARTIESNRQAIIERRDSAVSIANENALQQSSDFVIDHDRCLFTNKRNSFFLGRYRGSSVLVKRSAAAEIDCKIRKNYRKKSQPIWVTIAKRISYFQQIAIEKAQTAIETAICTDSSDQTRSPNASVMITSDVIASSISTTTTKRTNIAGPFLQIYEIFQLATDRSLVSFIEMAPNKSLHHHVKRRTSTPVTQAQRWTAQLLDGVIFLANHGVTHRSLRLEHVLLDRSNNARIIGWRRAIPIGHGRCSRAERRIRANNHLPPESFAADYDPRHVDLWSWGVMLCALCTCRYPFNVRRAMKAETEWNGFTARHRSSLFAPARHLLDRLFVTEPERRSTIECVQRSDFFNIGQHRNR